jgi:regulator of cell morphogenesis and NO signaling
MVMVISPNMKLADLIDINHNLLAVLSRLEVSLGFGEHTIDEACKLHGVNTEAFLLICNVYNFEGYVPSQALLDRADVRDIMKYLHNSHLDYTNTSLRDLESLITKMLVNCPEAQKKLVEKFFNGYQAEVKNHFDYEENTVLPYVKALLEGNRQEGYSIETFEENHGNIEEKLCDLKNIVMKYLPESCDQVLRYEVLHQIYHLEKDLTRHTLIEDNVLIPIVARMEARG